MVSPRNAPRSVALQVGLERHPAVALALSGQRATLRGTFAPHSGAYVWVHLDWDDGGETYLPARVRSVSEAGGEHVAEVDLCGVEGDWERFLRFLGPVAVAS